jgi:hypothetical protein
VPALLVRRARYAYSVSHTSDILVNVIRVVRIRGVDSASTWLDPRSRAAAFNVVFAITHFTTSRIQHALDQ